MIKFLNTYFKKKYLPRWTVLLFDLASVLVTFFLAYVLRFNFELEVVSKYINPYLFVYVSAVFLVSFWFTRSYSGILRHSTTKDITRIIFSLSFGGFLLLMLSAIARKYLPGTEYVVPYSVIIIHFSIASLIAVSSRLLVKYLYNEWLSTPQQVQNIMIFGAGRLGMIARNAIIQDENNNYKIVGFIDDNPSLKFKRISDIPIYSTQQVFDGIIDKKAVSELIIAIDKKNLSLKRKREIIDLALPKKLKVKEIPSVENWINGHLQASEIKKVRIEDLLGRDEIKLNKTKIIEGVKDQVILVTGAAGSIGSEIVNQLMLFNAGHVILFDKAESDLYDLQNDMASRYKNRSFTAIVGDVTNTVKLRKLFEKFAPSIVINAAAYKHVPLMEEFPCEAIRVNIGGTRNLANLSLEFGVQKFVLVSTDKAVNPTNVMGTSKRISEMYIQALAQSHKGNTQFITTRFGNVLGSNGSVIPLFKKQIENGGPVTVTHEEITRFFMTIPEACQLVLEASFMANGGEIFVFDMGEPVKIYDLAKKMIFLSGFIPNEDIKIEITGLRPGEKLYEELLNEQEGLLPTHNDKILIGKNEKYNYININKQIGHLLENVDALDAQTLVALMQDIAPEFVSQNSFYINRPLTKAKAQLLA